MIERVVKKVAKGSDHQLALFIKNFFQPLIESSLHPPFIKLQF